MKTSKPHQIIYVTTIIIPTQQDGEVYMLLALDDYSKFLFPAVMQPVNSSDQEFVDALTKLFNGVNEKHNPKIHAENTCYYSDLPQGFSETISTIIMPQDKLIYEPLKVKQAFEPVLSQFFK